MYFLILAIIFSTLTTLAMEQSDKLPLAINNKDFSAKILEPLNNLAETYSHMAEFFKIEDNCFSDIVFPSIKSDQYEKIFGFRISDNKKQCERAEHLRDIVEYINLVDQNINDKNTKHALLLTYLEGISNHFAAYTSFVRNLADNNSKKDFKNRGCPR